MATDPPASQPNITPMIQQTLRDALKRGTLDPTLTSEMMPALAEALTPYVARYFDKHGQLPTASILRVMANNFNQDGPLVEALLAHQTVEAGYLWQQVQQKLIRQTQRSWPRVNPVYQDKMVGQSYARVYRHLPKFLFQARLDTWIFTILKNEYLRLRARNLPDLEGQPHLEDTTSDNRTVGERLSTDEPLPEAVTAIEDSRQAFWQRVEQLGQQSGVELLRLHLAGYKLREIKEELGEDSPTLSTIQRRLKRLLAKIEADEVMRELAERLALMGLFLTLLLRILGRE